MVLDLVVQPAEQHIGQDAAADIAGRQDLPPEIVEMLIGGESRHAFVVGGERASHVQPEEALVDRGEHQCPDGGHDQQQCPGVDGQVA